MNSLTEQIPKQPDKPNPDKEEYKYYGTLGAPDAHRAARETANRNFIGGDSAWPEYQYPHIDPDELRENEICHLAVLTQIEKEEALNGETTYTAGQYETTARELAAYYRMKEALRTNASDRPSDKQLSRERAGQMSQELRGAPDKEGFRSLLAEKLSIIVPALDAEEPLKKQLASEYLDILGMDRAAAEQFMAAARPLNEYVRARETDTLLREDLLMLFPGLGDAMEAFQSDEPLRAAEAEPVFFAALEGLGLTQKGWSPCLIKNATTKAYSSLKDKVVGWGEYREDFDRWKRIETPVHEAFHSLRSQNGSEQDDIRCRQPTADSRPFEEGLVDAFAQLVSGRRPVIGKNHYVNQGLLYGLDTRESSDNLVRTARDIFELEWRQLVLGADDFSDSTIAAKKRTAQKDMYRAIRGGPDASDLSYFDGCRLVNPWLNELAEQPQEVRLAVLRWVLSGVFDPTNPRDEALYGGNPIHKFS